MDILARLRFLFIHEAVCQLVSGRPIRQFEADLRSGELRKQGLKVKLQEQPCQILAALIERPGR